ncbi:MAG: HAD family hydrolase [Coleofasciculaceae cyanobacterium]
MPDYAPTILALDFDGVLCDGMLEYFQTAWRTYCQVWQPKNQRPPDDLALSFCRLRPVVEIGWEMPILLRALMLGIADSKILEDWSAIVQKLIESENLDAIDIGKQLDAIRDEWIETDLKGWLRLHQFYPGVIERINRILSPEKASVENFTKLYIVTTKEGRFVNQLLQQQGIHLAESQIIGKECQRPKSKTLQELLKITENASEIWFVEDRLKTLQLVEQQFELNEVRLYLASWGYNTPAHQEFVRNEPRLKLLSLSMFAQDFSLWAS